MHPWWLSLIDFGDGYDFRSSDRHKGGIFGLIERWLWVLGAGVLFSGFRVWVLSGDWFVAFSGVRGS